MERKLSIDILKFIMSFFVVALHYSFLKDININISIILNQGIFRLAVPIFLFINGYYFFNIKNRSQYKKWLKKVGWLYLFWTLVYFYYILQLDLYHALVSIFYGYFHLWYVVAMIGASFIVFKLKNINTKQQLVIAFILYLIGCLIQYLSSYEMITLFKELKKSKTEGIPPIFYRNFLFFGLPFFLLGFIYRKNEKEINLFIRKKINILLLIGFVFLSLEIYINLKFSVKKSYELLLSLFFITPLIFMKFNFYEKKIDTKNLGFLSSSIYFIHPLVYFIFARNMSSTPTIQVLLTFSLSIILSILVIAINRKISIL